MQSKQNEIERRKKLAIAAIKNAFGTEPDEFGATLFVSHHLEEIEEHFWERHLGISTPEPKQVLDILVLRSHWSDEDNEEEDDDEGLAVFDFTLPEDVTDYVISVRFDDEGRVEDRKNRNILIHCANGHGRTSIFAAILLVNWNISKNHSSALELIQTSHQSKQSSSQCYSAKMVGQTTCSWRRTVVYGYFSFWKPQFSNRRLAEDG